MKRASKNNKSIISMTIGLSIKYYGWWLIMVNNVHLYKNNIMIFIMSIITVISIMNWSISTNRIEIARYISYNIVGLYITLILDILIWICIIYERYYIVNKNNMYIVIYYILNLIYLNNNSILILCLLYEYQSIPLISMINNISVINVKNKKGLIISNTLLITYSIISGLILYSSIYKISKSYNIELVQIMNSKVPYIAIISILISGSIKLSIFPFHIWLGKVHVEAPTIGSILLAGISLKTGFYINYIYIFLYKIISNNILNIMVYILMIGLIINNVVIYYSIDGKRWIALYSIIHMNAYYIILIISKFSIIYITVLIYGMIGHSLISSALFLIIGYIYDISNNKNIYLYSSNNISSYLLYNLFILLLGNSSFPLLVLFIYELLAFISLSIYSILNSIVLCILSCSNILSSLYIYYKYYSDNLYNSINVSYDIIVVILSSCIIIIIFNMGISALLPISLIY
jgi:NADH:ubiquinone oxidoreductase subunit 4 (subunit M)